MATNFHILLYALGICQSFHLDSEAKNKMQTTQNTSRAGSCIQLNCRNLKKIRASLVVGIVSTDVGQGSPNFILQFTCM